MPRIAPASLPEVLVVDPDVYRDVRGFFLETYHAAKYASAGVTTSFVQDNYSRSTEGTLRGIHLQIDPPQGKLVRVVRGAVFDVAVDLRIDSPSFGQCVILELSEDNFRQLYVPPGFGHAFYVTRGPADVEYKVTSPYRAEGELGILWNDPALQIEWPAQTPTLSDRDRSLPSLAAVRPRLLTMAQCTAR